MRCSRTVLLALCLLVGLLAVPVVLTWKEVKQERLNQALIAAVDRNDSAGVRRLLKQGANPDAALLANDKRPFWQRLSDLLRHRSEVTTGGKEALITKAITKIVDNEPANADIVDALADGGAIVNPGGGTDEDRVIPLLEAAYRQKWTVMRVLLAHHADANARGSWGGGTALMIAAEYHQAGIMEMLLNHGALVNARDREGDSALMYALRDEVPYENQGRETVECLLQHKALVHNKDNLGQTASTLARHWHDKGLIQMLEHAGAKE